MDDDHHELASEKIADGAALMCWHVLLADGSRMVELGNWRAPADNDPDDPALIASDPLRFTPAQLPRVLALARDAQARLPRKGRLPAEMPRNSCGMLAFDGPLQALACRGPDGAELLVLTVPDASVAVWVPLAKAGAMARVLAAACEALGTSASSSKIY